MTYIMLEYFVCMVIVASVATFVFASSLVMMLALEGIANAFRADSRAPARPATAGACRTGAISK